MPSPSSRVRHRSAPRPRTAAVAALVLVLGLPACGGGDDDDGAGAGGDTGGGGPSEISDTEGVDVDEPIQVTYRHIADSGGATPFEGATTRLVFEPGGEVAVYISNEESGLGRHGEYEYDDGELTLAVSSDEVTVDGSFDLDLDAHEIEMPFQAFSPEDGTSRWEREVVGVMDGTLLVFEAARYDEVAAIPRDEAVSRAQEYAAARVDLDGGALGGAAGGGDDGDDEEGSAGPLGESPDGAPEVQLAAVARQGSSAPRIVATSPYPNGVSLEYEDGTVADVVLYSWKSDAAASGEVLSLSQSPIASDPRVVLPTQPPGDGADDPPNDDALLVNPFLTDFGEKGAVAEATEQLESVGYSVEAVADGAATFEAITDGLVGSGSTPGFITISSHGSAEGAVATGEVLGTPGSPADEAAIHAKMVDVAKRIDAAYPGARKFEVGGSLAQPFRPIVFSTGPGTRKVLVGLSPSYWNWITGAQKADFGESFLFLSACETDRNPELRETIDAGAYLAFDEQASITAATDVFSYLVAQLVEPTRSAEEAYYNVVRTVNTGQMIYEADAIFDGSPSKSIPDQLNGYAGGSGGTPVPFMGSGWLDVDEVDGGQVWWLVFSGRWSQDAVEGVEKLKACWDGYWSKGDKGGLGSPACNASNTGTVPTESEVSYAVHLLTGDRYLSHGGTTVPRWTLADGR